MPWSDRDDSTTPGSSNQAPGIVSPTFTLQSMRATYLHDALQWRWQSGARCGTDSRGAENGTTWGLHHGWRRREHHVCRIKHGRILLWTLEDASIGGTERRQQASSSLGNVCDAGIHDTRITNAGINSADITINSADGTINSADIANVGVTDVDVTDAGMSHTPSFGLCACQTCRCRIGISACV